MEELERSISIFGVLIEATAGVEGGWVEITEFERRPKNLMQEDYYV